MPNINLTVAQSLNFQTYLTDGYDEAKIKIENKDIFFFSSGEWKRVNLTNGQVLAEFLAYIAIPRTREVETANPPPPSAGFGRPINNPILPDYGDFSPIDPNYNSNVTTLGVLKDSMIDKAIERFPVMQDRFDVARGAWVTAGSALTGNEFDGVLIESREYDPLKCYSWLTEEATRRGLANPNSYKAAAIDVNNADNNTRKIWFYRQYILNSSGLGGLPSFSLFPIGIFDELPEPDKTTLLQELSYNSTAINPRNGNPESDLDGEGTTIESAAYSRECAYGIICHHIAQNFSFGVDSAERRGELVQFAQGHIDQWTAPIDDPNHFPVQPFMAAITVYALDYAGVTIPKLKQLLDVLIEKAWHEPTKTFNWYNYESAQQPVNFPLGYITQADINNGTFDDGSITAVDYFGNNTDLNSMIAYMFSSYYSKTKDANYWQYIPDLIETDVSIGFWNRNKQWTQKLYFSKELFSNFGI